MNDKFKEECVPTQLHKISAQPPKPKGRPRKRPVSDSEDDTKLKKKKGRPRKRPASDSEDESYIDIEQIDSSLELVPNMEDSGNILDQVATKYSVRKKKMSAQQQTPGNIGKIEIKPPVKEKAGGRPKRVTRNKPKDQYVSVESSDVNTSDSEEETETPRPRIKGGRPKKKSRDAPEGKYIEALAIQYPESSSCPINEISGTVYKQIAKSDSSGKQQTGSRLGVVNENLTSTSSCRALKNKARIRGNDHENCLPSILKKGTSESNKNQVPLHRGEIGRLNESVTGNGNLKSIPSRCSSCKDVEIPRPVLCLAHNGKVAWDVKWRPSDSFDADSKHRMGYLAVLLGNGALEV